MVLSTIVIRQKIIKKLSVSAKRSRQTRVMRQTIPLKVSQVKTPENDSGLNPHLKPVTPPQAFLCCLQTQLTLQHTVDIQFATRPAEDMF